MSLRERFQVSTVRRAASILPPKDRKKIVGVMCIQIFMGLLDLLGVAVIGVLGALAVNGVASKQPGNRVKSFLELLQIDSLEFQTQAAILGILATFILISRTILSVYFMRKTLYFLSRRGAVVSSDLVAKLLSQPLLKLQEKSSQETIYSVTHGVNAITLGVLGSTANLVSDTALLVIMATGLFLVDPLIAFSTAGLFGAVGIAMYGLLHKRARRLGLEEATLTIASTEKIDEVLKSYRESVVRNRRGFYSKEIGEMRFSLANVLAEVSFMPNVSKYVIEITMVLGALFISALQFIFQDAAHAVATLSVFLAAGTRIAPAVLRVQQGLIVIKSSLGAAGPTLDLIESLENAPTLQPNEDGVDIEHEGFIPRIVISKICFSYPGSGSFAIRDASVEINAGSSLAFVGGSGAGKTTIVDLILGLLPPDSGKIEISGLSPSDAITKWPGSISYVPQDVLIINGTIRENVSMGYSSESFDDSLVWDALATAQLDDYVKDLPEGLQTRVGERGARLSGGQRQRLGIARAMFTKPKLLVLDEATSSLDGQTEYDVATAINKLKGRVTVVMIAHRLSTVRNCDQLVYLSGGEISSIGTFDQLRESVPDFDKQADLMGL